VKLCAYRKRAVLQLQPSDLVATLRKARALLGTQTVLRTLDSDQNATVMAIAEMILPRTQTPRGLATWAPPSFST
jgi:hypothetical protein